MLSNLTFPLADGLLSTDPDELQQAPVFNTYDLRYLQYLHAMFFLNLTFQNRRAGILVLPYFPVLH